MTAHLAQKPHGPRASTELSTEHHRNAIAASMTSFDFDKAAIARALAQIADQPTDIAEVYFEQREEIELPPETHTPGIRAWRETGFAVRLVRQGQAWLAARDEITPEAFADALRRIARAMPRAPYPHPRLVPPRWDEPPAAPELLAFPLALKRALGEHRMTVMPSLSLRRHRRTTLVVRREIASGVESENFYSVNLELPWGARQGCLVTQLDDPTADWIARQLVAAQRAHGAAPPEPGRQLVVLGPAATAVLLHEAVAHALETDTLALSGHPEAAIGAQIASSSLSVIDDPASAPEGVRRATDDEGSPVVRRFLLRAGRVEQPLADRIWARGSDRLLAGAGRRSDRHLPPGPRSAHLELAPGDLPRQELFAAAEGGLYLPAAERGRLDPLSGIFTLNFPHGQRIEHQLPGPPVGPCRIRGHLTDLLTAVDGVGQEMWSQGAGWCAKGGIKLPVWATAPHLLLSGVEVET